MPVSLPFEYKRRRQPMDETLPDGTPAMQVGMSDWMRPDVAPADDQQGEQTALMEELSRRRQGNPDEGFTPRASGESLDAGFLREQPGAQEVPALAGDAGASPASWLTDEMKRRGGGPDETPLEVSKGRRSVKPPSPVVPHEEGHRPQPQINPALPPARGTVTPDDQSPVAPSGTIDTGSALLDAMRSRTKDLGKPPVGRDKRGRPERAVGADSSLEGDKELLQATKDYQPQKAKGWKERVLIPIITGFLGGARGGDPLGGLGGIAANLGLNAAFPKAGDENWKARRQKELEGNVDTDLQTERTEAQTRILQQQPGLKDREQDRKEARDAALKDQQEWDRRFKSGRQATAENYIQWKMSNGDRRAQTAEGQLELRKEYNDLLADYRERRLDLDDRKAKVDEEIKRAELSLSKQREARLAAGGGGAGATVGSEEEQTYWNELADAYDQKSKDAMGVGQFSASEDYDALAKRARAKGDDIGGKRARTGGAAGGAGGTQYKYTEADVRARAKAKGKSEDAAVKLARENHLIPPQ